MEQPITEFYVWHSILISMYHENSEFLMHSLLFVWIHYHSMMGL